ncbi:MAG: hypothetical protein WCY82_08800 [Desulfotomaculaceae bacterium]
MAWRDDRQVTRLKAGLFVRPGKGKYYKE